MPNAHFALGKLINVKVTCEALVLVWRAADDHCYTIYGENIELKCHRSAI